MVRIHKSRQYHKFDIFHRYILEWEGKVSINLKLGRFLLLFHIVGVVTLALNPYTSLYARTNLGDKPVRISVHSLWPPNFLAYLADEKGLFEKNGVNVELLFYPDYHEVVERYALGEADGLTLVFSDAILQNAAGVETKVVYTLDDSRFGDARKSVV